MEPAVGRSCAASTAVDGPASADVATAAAVRSATADRDVPIALSAALQDGPRAVTAAPAWKCRPVVGYVGVEELLHTGSVILLLEIIPVLLIIIINNLLRSKTVQCERDYKALYALNI